jgi:hypothetical protein
MSRGIRSVILTPKAYKKQCPGLLYPLFRVRETVLRKMQIMGVNLEDHEMVGGQESGNSGMGVGHLNTAVANFFMKNIGAGIVNHAYINVLIGALQLCTLKP